MVNRILWGQYKAIAQDTVAALQQSNVQHLLQISCAYGEIIPWVARDSGAGQITLLDVAPIQLACAEEKLAKVNALERVELLQANAEHLPFENNQFDGGLLFFLLHELPPVARQNVLKEALRCCSQHLVIADYAEKTDRHWFHNRWPFRGVFESLEPCLGAFWQTDLFNEIESVAAALGKKVRLTRQKSYFAGFYRLWHLTLDGND